MPHAIQKREHREQYHVKKGKKKKLCVCMCVCVSGGSGWVLGDGGAENIEYKCHFKMQRLPSNAWPSLHPFKIWLSFCSLEEELHRFQNSELQIMEEDRQIYIFSRGLLS